MKQDVKDLKKAIHQADPSGAMHAEAMQHTDLLENISEVLNKQLQIVESKKENTSNKELDGLVSGFLNRIKIKVDKPSDEELIQLIKPLIPNIKDGKDGHTPTSKELLSLIQPLFENIKQGKDGKDGRTPTLSELRGLIIPLIPEPVRGPAGRNGRDGRDGKTPSKSELESIIKPLIPNVKDGKDAPILTDIVKAVIDEIKKSRAIDISHLKNSEQVTSAIGKMKKIDNADLRWHGGGMSSSHFISGEVVSGSGTSWTLQRTPRLFLGLYANGQRLSTAQSDYTISGKNITTTISWTAGTVLADYYW